MNVLEHDAAFVVAPLTASATATKAPRKQAVGTFQCLVVSACPVRRSMLERAAYDAGWDTHVCATAAEGWGTIKRQRFQLALIDMDGETASGELRLLSEDVAEMKRTLLVLCGNEGEPLEEIWARQLGAWLYLPGVSAGSDVMALCEQARPVAEKLQGR